MTASPTATGSSQEPTTHPSGVMTRFVNLDQEPGRSHTHATGRSAAPNRSVNKNRGLVQATKQILVYASFLDSFRERSAMASRSIDQTQAPLLPTSSLPTHITELLRSKTNIFCVRLTGQTDRKRKCAHMPEVGWLKGKKRSCTFGYSVFLITCYCNLAFI